MPETRSTKRSKSSEQAEQPTKPSKRSCLDPKSTSTGPLVEETPARSRKNIKRGAVSVAVSAPTPIIPQEEPATTAGASGRRTRKQPTPAAQAAPTETVPPPQHPVPVATMADRVGKSGFYGNL